MPKPRPFSPSRDALVPAVRDVLLHHPGPAVHFRELFDLVGPESGSPPDPEHLRTVLDSGLLPVRVLEPRSRSGVTAGLRTWVLLLARPELGRSRPTLPRLLERSLSILGRETDDASPREMARWERLLDEERRVRSAVRRWAAPPAPERRPTTTPLRDRRRRARARALRPAR